MMSVWIAVLAVGAASLAFRLLPLLAVARLELGARRADILRHAGAGAIAAFVVLALLGPASGSGIDATVAVAVAAGGVRAWRGSSTMWVVLGGGAAFAIATGLASLL
jgi:branched-subunit amino acid transport protein